MKVAVLSESPADETAIRILAEACIERKSELVEFNLRSRGWPSVQRLLPTVMKHLHYRTSADGLIVVVDSNRSPLHAPHHDAEPPTDCRLCLLRECANQVKQQLRPVPGREPLRIAIGLAVPCIEAWYRVGVDPHVTEAAWILALQSRKFPYSCKALKRAVYGTEFCSLAQETLLAAKEASRLAGTLAALESSFPNGFGALFRDLREWSAKQQADHQVT